MEVLPLRLAPLKLSAAVKKAMNRKKSGFIGTTCSYLRKPGRTGLVQDYLRHFHLIMEQKAPLGAKHVCFSEILSLFRFTPVFRP